MKKSQKFRQPDERPVSAADTPADVMAGSVAAADEPLLESPTAEEIADPTLIWQENLAAREKELAEVAEKYLRLAAEYDNFRRRSQKEKETLYTDSIALVVKEWLPVVDNLERAVLAAGTVQSDEARLILTGIQLVQKQITEVLGRLNVVEIDCLGKLFDPNQQEAVMHIEDDQVGASTVVEVFQKGYRRDDRVIRYSIVKVAN